MFLVALLLLNLAVSGFFLWLACRVFRARRAVRSSGGPELFVPVSYWRALWAAFLLHFLSIGAILLLRATGVVSDNVLIAALLALGVMFVLGALLVGLVLRLTFGKLLLVTLAWSVILVAYLSGFVWSVTNWVAEAFIVPTGGMAETILGYHKQIKCPSCGYEFPVNCSNEVDAPEAEPRVTNGCTCPNCRRVIRLVDPKRDGRQPLSGVEQQDGMEFMEILDPGWSSGDRFLAGKRLLGGKTPGRLDVIVFDYPERPNQGFRYIQRLIGLPGETIAIQGGDLFVLAPGKGPSHDDRNVPAEDLWQKELMHANDEAARKLFERGEFEIIRKPPEVLLAMKRLVYDNDHPADDLKDAKWQRWRPDANWKPEDDGKAFRCAEGGKNNEIGWLRYHHLLRQYHGRPSLISDFLGYNSSENLQWDRDLSRWSPIGGSGDYNGTNWVGDLILECEIDTAKAEGEFVVELVRGPDRFRARWDLASGDCNLIRVHSGGKNEREEKLASKATNLKKGVHHLCFANVDRRLTVWVDDKLPFGDGVSYDPPRDLGPAVADLQPASIGVQGGALTVRKLKLWRDTYHAVKPNRVTPEGSTGGGDVRISENEWVGPQDGKELPESWKALKDPPLLTLYVQPGHYLCLGDNSPQSSDSRSWGLVPERLLLGKALLVYYPFSRARSLR